MGSHHALDVQLERAQVVTASSVEVHEEEDVRPLVVLVSHVPLEALKRRTAWMSVENVQKGLKRSIYAWFLLEQVTVDAANKASSLHLPISLPLQTQRELRWNSTPVTSRTHLAVAQLSERVDDHSEDDVESDDRDDHEEDEVGDGLVVVERLVSALVWRHCLNTNLNQL